MNYNDYDIEEYNKSISISNDLFKILSDKIIEEFKKINVVVFEEPFKDTQKIHNVLLAGFTRACSSLLEHNKLLLKINTPTSNHSYSKNINLYKYDNEGKAVVINETDFNDNSFINFPKEDIACIINAVISSYCVENKSQFIEYNDKTINKKVIRDTIEYIIENQQKKSIK